MRRVFLIAMLVVGTTTIGCSGVVPSMSGAPAPRGSAKFGTWLGVGGNYTLSVIEVAAIDSAELRRRKDLSAEVIFRDTWVNAATVTKEELLKLDPGATVNEVRDPDLHNGADTEVLSYHGLESCGFYYSGAELVEVEVWYTGLRGEIRLNHDDEKILKINRSSSLADFEKILGPATSKMVAQSKLTETRK